RKMYEGWRRRLLKLRGIRKNSHPCDSRRSNGRADFPGCGPRNKRGRCMTQPSASSKNNALLLSPEPPVAGFGGGGLRSASLLEYLRQRYDVQEASFELPHHSKSFAARAWRN